MESAATDAADRTHAAAASPPSPLRAGSAAHTSTAFAPSSEMNVPCTRRVVTTSCGPPALSTTPPSRPSTFATSVTSPEFAATSTAVRVSFAHRARATAARAASSGSHVAQHAPHSYTQSDPDAKMLGGASQTVSKIRVKCNDKQKLTVHKGVAFGANRDRTRRDESVPSARRRRGALHERRGVERGVLPLRNKRK